MSGESSIYEIEFSERKQYAVLRESVDTDIAIIGGGLTGISAALHLAENGYSAMVLEAGKLGTGGSGRNGGHVCQGWPNDFYHIQRQLSEQDAKVAWDCGMAAVNLVKDRVDRYKIDCELTFGYVMPPITSDRWSRLMKCNASGRHVAMMLSPVLKIRLRSAPMLTQTLM